MTELPENIRTSKYLNGQQLQLLQSVNMPAIDASFDDDVLKNIVQYYSLNPDEMEAEVHKYAATLLTEQKVNEAWQVLLATTIV